MIQGKNPITQNSNVRIAEVGTGHVAADVDSGLLYGSVQLPRGADGDRWFQQMTGQARPDGYKEDLQAIVDASGDRPGNIPDNLLASVKDVLDAATDTQVLVTTVNAINFGERFGVPNSQSIAHLSIQPDDINVGGLPIKNNLDEEAMDLKSSDAKDTASTRAARRSADKLRGPDTQTGAQAEADANADKTDGAEQSKDKSVNSASIALNPNNEEEGASALDATGEGDGEDQGETES